jgi:translation initiation factor 2 beta subunit (eIF-2beta)/eIF-5
MPEIIKASEKNIEKVFCNDYLFEIPVFQRPYAWETEQVDDLLDDLLFAMRRGDDEPYFLGNIVLIKGDDPNSKVVDGQQRLTTLTMLLCVLRELEEDSEVKSELDAYIRQPGGILAGRAEVVRLGLRRQDQDFFYHNVQTKGGVSNLLETTPSRETDSQERIVENVKRLQEELIKLDPPERQRLAAFIINHCYLVVVSTSDMTSASRIFSVLNTRGLDLSPTDTLKAEIIDSIMGAEQQETYGKKWEDIEQELGRDRFGALFAHLRSIYAKAKQRGSLEEEFRQHVLSRHSPAEFVDDVLDRYDDVYQRVLGIAGGGDEKGHQEIDGYLRHLRRLDNVDWIPPALAFFHRNAQNTDQLAWFTKDLERLAYGLFIRRANINERINRYAEVMRRIEQDDAVSRDDGPLQLRGEEKESILRILDGPIYSLPRVPSPLLLRLNGLVTDPDTNVNIQAPTISIEHVLPQHPSENSQWLTWFPDNDERSQWTHRLANLVLLSFRKNTRASNWEFDRKKGEYFQRGGVTPFALTLQVINEKEWTPDVLERRQSELVDKLKTEWRLG